MICDSGGTETTFKKEGPLPVKLDNPENTREKALDQRKEKRRERDEQRHLNGNPKALHENTALIGQTVETLL